MKFELNKAVKQWNDKKADKEAIRKFIMNI